jgi:hypothetical protein
MHICYITQIATVTIHFHQINLNHEKSNAKNTLCNNHFMMELELS